MSDLFESFKNQVASLQEKVDNAELDPSTITAQVSDQLRQELLGLKQILKDLYAEPTPFSISFRLVLQSYKSQLKQLTERINTLTPKLDIPLNHPMPPGQLFEIFVRAKRHELKNDKFSIDPDAFLETVKQIRLKARKYYKGAKTQVALGMDNQGVFVSIKRRTGTEM